MSAVSFSPLILASPFVSLDQILLSLVYSADCIDADDNWKVFFVPETATLSPLSLLGVLYGYLLRNPQISRIVYIIPDDTTVSYGTADSTINFVLGKSLSYDSIYYNYFDQCDLEYRHNFLLDHHVRSSHVLYSSILDNVTLCPVVVPRCLAIESKTYIGLLSCIASLIDDKSTVYVVLGACEFTLNQDDTIMMTPSLSGSTGHLLQNYCTQSGQKLCLLHSDIVDGSFSPYRSYQGIYAL